MKENSSKKYTKYQNQSLMALTTSNQAEPTKKVIQPQQLYHFQPVPHSNHRLYIFRLPFESQISLLVSGITSRFSNFIIHAEEDELGAQIILQGLQLPGIRGKIAKLCDYFVFCCSKGLRFGKLEETYNVILLTIRKQVIQNQCILTVTNPYSQLMKTDMRQRYIQCILDPLQQELKNISKSENLQQQHIAANPYLSDSSPTKIDMLIHKKIYDLFILPENKDYNRYKNIFLHSLQKIQKQIDQYRHKVSNPTPSVKKVLSPSNITQSFIKESQSLLTSLKNTYKQEEGNELAYLHSLLSSQTAETVSLYTIQEAICMYQLANLKQIYHQSIADQCQMFNRNVQYLNQHKTDEQCFQHLTLKKKYRLPQQKRPYFSAIERLKTLQHVISFRQALLVIQQTFSDVKTDCYVSHKGKVQLASMDELLPVIIFIAVRAAVKNFPAIIMIIGDYVRYRSVFELEERIMTAFYAAIQDISRGWEIPEEKKQMISSIILLQFTNQITVIHFKSSFQQIISITKSKKLQYILEINLRNRSFFYFIITYKRANPFVHQKHLVAEQTNHAHFRHIFEFHRLNQYYPQNYTYHGPYDSHNKQNVYLECINL